MFIKIHDDIDECCYINMNHVSYVNTEDRILILVNGSDVTITRQHEWEKILNWVKSNEVS